MDVLISNVMGKFQRFLSEKGVIDSDENFASKPARTAPEKVSPNKINEEMSGGGVHAINNFFHPYLSGGVYQGDPDNLYEIFSALGNFGDGGGAAPVNTTTPSLFTFNITASGYKTGESNPYFFMSHNVTFQLASASAATTFNATLKFIENDQNIFPDTYTFSNTTTVSLSATDTTTLSFIYIGGPGSFGYDNPTGSTEYKRFITGTGTQINGYLGLSNLSASVTPSFGASGRFMELRDDLAEINTHHT